MQDTLNGYGTTRRSLLLGGAGGALGLSLFGIHGVCTASDEVAHGADLFGPLQDPDVNGLRLPLGFRSRMIAVSEQTVAGTGYIWHRSPDGGATFATTDGGWVYVSNAERSTGGGGVGAVRFDSAGNIVDAYAILSGTSRNCAGGPTPWGTWLSCEEVSAGAVWECDPFTSGSQGSPRPLMGRFKHEAAAVDPVNRYVYLTEDRPDGLLYRFRPTRYPDLASGTLEAAEILDPRGDGRLSPKATRPLAWHAVPDPTVSAGLATRYQVAAATTFNGGEGAWYENGLCYFTTKGDNRVWRLVLATQEISIVYDRASSATPELVNVDNVFVAPNGDVYVAEDPGDLQIVAITSSGALKPIVQLVGISGTEITGPSLSPDGSRLYFSSQRNPGATFEVTGPFLGSASLAQVVPAVGGMGQALLVLALAAAAKFKIAAGRRSETSCNIRARRRRQADPATMMAR